jgi:hypothetical protein
MVAEPEIAIIEILPSADKMFVALKRQKKAQLPHALADKPEPLLHVLATRTYPTYYQSW